MVGGLAARQVGGQVSGQVVRTGWPEGTRGRQEGRQPAGRIRGCAGMRAGRASIVTCIDLYHFAI